MTTHLKAITIWQPWASLIIIGAKPYEFRSWLPPKSLVGQRIVNHAAARKTRLDEVEDLIERLSDPALAWTTCLRPDIALPFLKGVQGALRMGQQPLPLGCGLGTAMVGTPVTGARADKLKPKSRHVARTLRAAASDLRAGLHVEGDEK